MPPELDVYSLEQSQWPVQSNVISKLYHTTKWPIPGYGDFHLLHKTKKNLLYL
jgi:hypothetical protein